MRVLALLVPVFSFPLFASNVQLLPALPNGAISRAMQLDAAGNIYLAGSVIPAKPKISQDGTDAFVAKVSADGSKVVYFTILSGSFAEDAAGLVLGPDGSVYVTGSTGSNDFPVTPGAYQTTFNPLGASQGFLVKVNPSGTVVYSSYINGPVFTTATGIAIGKAGEIFVTGMGGPSYPASTFQPAQGFVLKLDASLTNVLLSEYGYGGGLITLDSQGNIYIAGNAQPSGQGPTFSLPALPAGAFQSNQNATFCNSASGPGGAFARFCTYQLVAKLDAAGKLIWGTYVTGTYGAIPAGMAVDSAGNVIVAGTTNSSDYPVTPGAFQTAYTAAAPQIPHLPSVTGPPNSIGYVTKVSANGSSLMWSTYFGGSFQDEITGMAVSATGEILLSGRAGSNDLVFTDVPDGCRPTANQVLGFVARLAPDGASAAATQPVPGAPDCLYTSCTGLASYQSGWPLALRPDGSAVIAGSKGTLATVDFSASSRVACVEDPADNVQLRSVEPGQLLTILGADIAPADPFTPPGGVAASTDDFGVFFNGIPAPIVFSSAQQINVQVPYEIAGASSVQMQVSSKKITHPFSEIRTVGVAARQPAIFLSPAALLSQIPGWSTCGGAAVFGQTAVALNEDGTMNDCANPAVAGSKVTVFLGGMGQVSPAPATGEITQGPAVNLTPSLDPGSFTGTTVIATQSLPGSITGVAQVPVRGGSLSQLLIDPTFGGTPLRERVILVWMK